MMEKKPTKKMKTTKFYPYHEKPSKRRVRPEVSEDRTEWAEDETELAEDRTDWAEERTLLAKERSFNSWSRTGIASVISGLGVAQFLTEVHPEWMAKSLAVILIITGGFIFAVAFMSYRKALNELTKQKVRSIPLWILFSIVIALMLSTGIAFYLIIVK